MPISVSHKLKPLELARLKGMAQYKLETFRRVLQYFDHQRDPDGKEVLDRAMKMLAEDSFNSATEAMRKSDRNEVIGDLDDASENLKSAYQVLDYAIHMVRNYCMGFYRRKDLPSKYQPYSSRY